MDGTDPIENTFECRKHDAGRLAGTNKVAADGPFILEKAIEMELSQQYPEVTAYLRELGHTDLEVNEILERVRQYETETKVDSVINSIESGSFDITAAIHDALAEMDESS